MIPQKFNKISKIILVLESTFQDLQSEDNLSLEVANK